MNLLRFFRRHSVADLTKEGLAQAERELYKARLAKHDADAAIEYWLTRAKLLQQLGQTQSPETE